jgi:dTDP-3-amino-3,4,6-trideoxy-alpha-D-glucose transaminase
MSGEPPMSVRFLDLGKLYREDAADYDAAYRRVMASGRWILGPELEAFERDFAAFCGVRHAVGVGNGLDALLLALRATGIGSGDEVVVPAHTFIATWLAVLHCGATPVAVEPAQAGFNIDCAGVEAAITPRTRAVLPVHLYGAPAEIGPLAALCADRRLVLIEDAAQAHGAVHRERPVGGFGRLGCFSFYPAKNLGAFGDAGAVVTDDPDLAVTLRRGRNYGGIARHEHETAGVNSRLDELQAAFLRVRLTKLAEHHRRRTAQAEAYLNQLDGIPGVVCPSLRAGDVPAWHLFVIRCQRRDALRAWLASEGIETLIHYPKPVYRLPAFAAYGPGERTESDRLCDEVLSLPLGPHLSLGDVDKVASAIRAFAGQGIR